MTAKGFRRGPTVYSEALSLLLERAPFEAVGWCFQLALSPGPLALLRSAAH